MNAFTLTPLEEKMLVMKRAGMKSRDILFALGWAGWSTGSNQITAAVEKDRLRRLRDVAPRSGTSLRRARGNSQRNAGSAQT